MRPGVAGLVGTTIGREVGSHDLGCFAGRLQEAFGLIPFMPVYGAMLNVQKRMSSRLRFRVASRTWFLAVNSVRISSIMNANSGKGLLPLKVAAGHTSTNLQRAEGPPHYDYSCSIGLGQIGRRKAAFGESRCLCYHRSHILSRIVGNAISARTSEPIGAALEVVGRCPGGAHRGLLGEPRHLDAARHPFAHV